MQYFRSLDGLRALLALAVIGFHCRLPGLSSGFVAVDVFFVLSGYLITAILRAEVAATGTVDIGGFYVRRAVRLWPALLSMVAVYLVIAPLLPPHDVVGDAIAAAFYLSDVTLVLWGSPDYLKHTWSLAVEQHFYLVWPIVVVATARMERRTLLALLATAFVMATVWRWATWMAVGDWTSVYYRFDLRLSGLLLGALIAVAGFRPGAGAAQLSVTIGLALVVAVAICGTWRSGFVATVGILVIELGTAAIIVGITSCHATMAGSLLSAPPLVWLGLRSYAIYIWHYPIARMMRTDVDPWTTTAVVLALSVVLAALSYAVVERPMIDRIRRRPVAALT